MPRIGKSGRTGGIGKSSTIVGGIGRTIGRTVHGYKGDWPELYKLNWAAYPTTTTTSTTTSSTSSSSTTSSTTA